MGAFYLVFEPDPTLRARTESRLQAAFVKQGFSKPQSLEFRNTVVGFYGKSDNTEPQLAHGSQGEFAGLSGTALVDGAFGAKAAQALLSMETLEPDWSRIVGSFCAVIGNRDIQRMFLDPLGVHKVYTNESERVFASSFLALANTIDTLTPNPQGVYEYVHQEACYGSDTVANEIRQASCQGSYEFTDCVKFKPWTTPERPKVENESMDVHLHRCLSRLRTVFSVIKDCFGNEIDTALSGGYDSRLTLALLQEQGVVPSIHVYGTSSSGDVQIARHIANAEGISLEHFDKAAYPKPAVSEFSAIVRRNYLAFDGWPPAGIFDSGVDLETRRTRASGERLMLNGGGGEIFRNFFYLPSYVHSPRQLVHSFYNRYTPGWCSAAFDESNYVQAIQRKLVMALGISDTMTREDVEMAYPVFRCGFWMGRNNAINNRLGWAMTPFIDYDLVRLAVRVPLRYKNHGRFEAALIREVSPGLASYPSDYGHDFSRSPPRITMFKDWLTYLRPPTLRRFTYRIRYRQPKPRPDLLSRNYLDHVLDPSMPHMSDFYHVDKVNDPSAYARIATLEYLFQTLSPGVSGRRDATGADSEYDPPGSSPTGRSGRS